MTQRVAVLGAGKMGEALLSGMLRGRTAGRRPVVVVARRRGAGRKLLARALRRATVLRNAEAARPPTSLMLTVKPQDMAALLDDLGAARAAGHAGRVGRGRHPDRRSSRSGWPTGTPVVRVMSNTPVLVDEAMSAISAGRARAAEEHLRWPRSCCAPVGKMIRVPESQQDAVTALSGSGPAYFFYLVEAMTDAGILLGLPREVAHDLIVQTAIGAAVMLRDSGEHPVKLREAVTSPAGTTINAIREMENHGVRAAMLAALEAARDRSRELGRLHE